MNAKIAEDYDGLLVRSEPKDGAIQIVPQSLVERFLMLAHYQKAAGHPGRDRMLTFLRKSFAWLCVSRGDYDCVSSCPFSDRKMLRPQKRASKLTLFPHSSHLEFISHLKL